MEIHDNEIPPDPTMLIKRISRRIIVLKEMIQLITNELDYIPAPSDKMAQLIVARSVRRFSALYEAWNTIIVTNQIKKDNIDFLMRRIEYVENDLHILDLRRIHHNNLKMSLDRLKAQEISLSAEKLETLLRQYINHEKDSIIDLESRKNLDAHEQNLLTIHHRNLTLYHEMLSGARPYAPIPLIVSVMKEKKAIEDIDTSLMSIQDDSVDQD